MEVVEVMEVMMEVMEVVEVTHCDCSTFDKLFLLAGRDWTGVLMTPNWSDYSTVTAITSVRAPFIPPVSGHQ